MQLLNCFTRNFPFSCLLSRFIFQQSTEKPKEAPVPSGAKEKTIPPEKVANDLVDTALKKLHEVESKKTERVDLPGGVEFFKSADGKIIAYTEYGDEIFISKDGKTFYELKGTGYGGTGEGHDISFNNPHDQTKGELHRKGNTLIFGEDTYTKMDPRKSVEAVKLPEVRQKEYSFTLKSGEKLTVTADKYHYSYESFKLFIDDREIPIKETKRFRDGGTTYIKTDEGDLYVPVPWSGKKPTWKGEKITKNKIFLFPNHLTAGNKMKTKK